MRSSLQRDIILDIIVNSCNHLTVEQIYDKAKIIKSDISLATIYRNVNQLVLNNKIRRLKLDDNVDKYDKVDPHHNHFVCDCCGCIEDIYDHYLIPERYINGNLITNYDLMFRGICSVCQKKED